MPPAATARSPTCPTVRAAPRRSSRRRTCSGRCGRGPCGPRRRSSTRVGPRSWSRPRCATGRGRSWPRRPRPRPSSGGNPAPAPCDRARERVLLSRRLTEGIRMAGGFWNYALEDPDALAVVDPDGTEFTAGEVAARSHRMVHGLRSLGLRTGDTVAAVLPNGINPVTVYLGALESGLYYVPINYRLSPPEVAYILRDSDAKAFVSHERFADLVPGAADDAGIAGDARLAVGEVPGFRSLADALDAQPTSMPEDRSTGAAMHYTSGTTGQ